MPLLQVRDFPQDMYDQLGQVAAAERRSISQQVVVMLRDALALPESAIVRRRRALAEVAKFPPLPPNSLDPVQLIREDRER